MKRAFAFFIALSCIVLAPLNMSAQTTVGLLAGWNLTTFGGSDLSPHGHHTAYNRHASLNVRGYLDVSLSERVGLRLGAGYLGKGAEAAYSSDGSESVSFKSETRIGYVEIPALLRFRVNPGRSLSAHLLIGPALSFRISCEVESDSDYWGGTTKCRDSSLNVRNTDLGATGGVGFEIGLSEGLMLVGESLYTLGLRTVGESGDGVKNRAFSLSLGVAFLIG